MLDSPVNVGMSQILLISRQKARLCWQSRTQKACMQPTRVCLLRTLSHVMAGLGFHHMGLFGHSTLVSDMALDSLQWTHIPAALQG